LCRGYTAPEYALRGELSEKADIYSFGVLLLEIICSRKNTDRTLPSEMQYLPGYVSSHIFINILLEMHLNDINEIFVKKKVIIIYNNYSIRV